MIQLIHVIDDSLSAAARDRLHTLIARLPRDRFAQQVIALDARAQRNFSDTSINRAATVRERGPSQVASPHNAPDSSPPRKTVSDIPIHLDAFASGARLRRADNDNAVFHPCNLRALTACRLHTRAPLVFNLDPAPDSPRAKRWLRALAADHLTCVTGSQSARRAAIEAGARPDRTLVVRAPIDFGAINTAKCDKLRDQLLPAADGPIILTTGPATQTGGQLNVAWSAAILQQIYPRVRLIIPFATSHSDRKVSRHAHRARRLLTSANIPETWLTPPPDWSWPQLTACADLFIDAAEQTVPTEPLAWAMAAGLPIIGTAIRSITELIADRSNGLLVRDNAPHKLAAAMLTALEDATLRRNITETARGQAFEVFSARDFTDNMAAVFDNARARRAPNEGVTDTAMVTH